MKKIAAIIFLSTLFMLTALLVCPPRAYASGEPATFSLDEVNFYDLVKSNGGQCIDSGIPLNYNTLMEGVAMELDMSLESGRRQAYGKNYGPYFFFGVSGSTQLYAGIGSNVIYFPIDNTRHVYKLDSTDSKLYVDGVKMDVGSYKSISTGSYSNLYLFTISGTPFTFYTTGRLYSATISQGGTPVRHFIPASSKNGGKIGLYDTINKKFYPNETSSPLQQGSLRYAIDYDANGGSDAPDFQLKEPNSTATLSSKSPSRAHYRFLGWSTSPSSQTVEYLPGSPYADNKNLQLYAAWKGEEFTCLFNPEGGTVTTTSKTVIYSESYGDLPAPTKIGFQFDGWYTQSNGGGTEILPDTIVTATSYHTLYSKWLPKHSVNLETDGGTVNNDNITEYTETIGAELPTDVTRNGYTFDGWYTESDFSGNQVTEISSSQNTDEVYYAKWVPVNYSVTYNDNGATIPHMGGDTLYNIETTEFNLPTAPQKEGYSFAGWMVTNSASNGEGFASGDTFNTETRTLYTSYGDVTLTALWAELYTIDYESNGGSGTMESNTTTQDIAFILPKCSFTAPKGKQFKEWAIGTPYSRIRATAQEEHTFTENTKVYAIWEDTPRTEAKTGSPKTGDDFAMPVFWLSILLLTSIVFTSSLVKRQHTD